MRALAIALAFGSLAACEDTVPAYDLGVTDASPTRDLRPPPDLSSDASMAIEFADFVLGLIANQTSDSTKPTTTEDKIFVDSMDPTRFAPLF